ncbi:hypothetical protein YWIDRAFT_00335 [Streptomyces sp. SceaMP-e96]|nr:hypothetical protein YWIDRAFT_00335 [Streptomyces sp. SceaMP-e96]
MHANRTGPPVGDTASSNQPMLERLLTRNQAVHTRTVLEYVAAHSPHPEAEVRLAVLMPGRARRHRERHRLAAR